jgi:outer membrane protein
MVGNDELIVGAPDKPFKAVLTSPLSVKVNTPFKRLRTAMADALHNAPRATYLAVGVLLLFLVLPYAEKSNALLAEDNKSRQELLIPYEQRVASVDEQHSQRMSNTQEEIPPGFQPWWTQYLDRPLWGSDRALTIDVETLVVGAMKHSPKVLALSTIPEIQKTEICAAQAAFDPRAFLESKFIRTSDTATTILTAGGDTTLTPRYRDQNWYYSGGVRRKTEMGGQFEASQKFGLENNNALIYQPEWALYPQGSSRLTLSYTQPLLNGAGRAYNESVTVLAAIDAGVATDQFAADLQDHLLEVNKAYWTLYLERVTLVQKRQLLQQAESILSELDARKKFDANGGQIVRVKSAVESRRASLVRFDAAVHNAEARINLLVNDSQLFVPDHAELIPIQHPHLQYPSITVRDSLITALYNRPEVNQSLQQIRAASVRQQVAQKDLLPVLDAVLSLYTMGLEGDSRMGKAFVDQFSVGEPGYTAGLQFEVPLGNRLAKARLLKRQLEFQQFSLQLRQTVAVLVEEIEVAVRDVDASFREAQAQYLAMQASATEIKYLEARWRLLPSEEQVAGIVLEDLLAAQDRYGNAECNFATAQVSYNISLANLNRATGILLKCLPLNSPSQQAAPAKERIEEIPVPPTQIQPPVPQPPPPPDISHAPANAGNAVYNVPLQPQANNNRVAGNVRQTQPESLPVQRLKPTNSGQATSAPPSSGVLAPLPPVISNVPSTAENTANTNPILPQENVNRAAGNMSKIQSKPVPAQQTKSPNNGAESTPLQQSDILAPLPPSVANRPATATFAK